MQREFFKSRISTSIARSRSPKGLGFLSLLISALFASLFFSNTSYAKDLAHRLGVGYSDQFSENLPSMAMRYYPEPYIGVGAALGVDTEEDQSKFGFMVRLYRILYVEDHMNFYMGTSAGLISRENNNDSDSGFEITGYAGSEFFFSELSNLGFSFEVGVGVTSIDSEVRFRTIGDHPLRAGIIFYLDDAE